jgi:4-hydroxy-tetrahydrodipicolinate reductase
MTSAAAREPPIFQKPADRAHFETGEETAMSQQAAPRNYRVVQWATGNIGSYALKGVIQHPQMTLAGVFVYGADKVGRDAGELCRLAPVGVGATNKIEDILAAKPDCVLYMPQYVDLDDVCRLLAAGINIVTTRTEFHNPKTLEPAVRDRVEAACRQGGSSIHSTGSSPGFITEAMPIVLTSIQRRLDSYIIDEFANLSQRDSPQMIFEVMGFGQPLAEFDQRRVAHLKHAFGPSLQLIAEAMGITIDSMETHGELAAARRRTEIAAGVIEAGTVAAQRLSLVCKSDGKPVMQFRANWYCTPEVEPDWDLRETGWRVQVAGDAPMDVDIRFPVPLERFNDMSPGLTANRAVNAVPFVCEAPAGVRTTLDLPQIITRVR